jgi:serine/threonine-protein kinase
LPADAGIRFGQYVLLRRIARGGMAEVFLAQQRGLEGFDRRVAVKRILPHLQDAPDFLKMFLGEARLAAQLAHPNIVHIYEFGKVTNDYFIAMEFVEGVHVGQLFNKCAEGDRISPTLVARIGADAAAALHYAHELRAPSGNPFGLVHRDVSPANIMISFDGIVKLCDFGIAKAAAAGDQLTNPGQVKGKYAYMSPEQTTASQLDGRSDVFSLGIVLWELLTGKYIVPRGDAVAAMRAIRDGKLEPIEKAAPSVPAPLARAISHALEPKRDKRATAADLAVELEAFIKSSPELATPMQLASWIRPRFPRESMMQMPSPAQGGPGTQAQPGTQASPATASVPQHPTLTPESVAAQPTMLPPTPPLYPQRRIVKLVEDTDEGSEIYSVSDLEESATVKAPRFRPIHTPSDAATLIARPNPADEATVHASPPMMTGPDGTEIVDARHLPRPPADDEDSQNGTFMETTERDRRTPIPSGPVAIPTRLHPPVPPSVMPPNVPPMASARGMQLSHDSRSIHTLKGVGTGTQATLPRKSSSPDLTSTHGTQRRSTTMTHAQVAQLRRRRLLFTIGGLGGLMLLSFLIALCASSNGNEAPAQRDAAVIRMTDTDAAALPLAPPPLDAGITVTPIDATADIAMAYLTVRTVPEGGTVRVGDQVRVASAPSGGSGAATAQLLVEAGTVKVEAELAGYQPETREVVVERGENKTIEIKFSTKIVRSGATGRLTVKTTPWSDVYLGSQKLGQAPFTDLEVPVGTHQLTFENPSRPAVIKTVTIKAGKPTRLQFNLP